MVLVDYIGIFLHFRILLTKDCACATCHNEKKTNFLKLEKKMAMKSLLLRKITRERIIKRDMLKRK